MLGIRIPQKLHTDGLSSSAQLHRNSPFVKELTIKKFFSSFNFSFYFMNISVRPFCCTCLLKLFDTQWKQTLQGNYPKIVLLPEGP
jgi:hypothetical protein